MKINDSIYGEFEIQEPVVLEIIESPVIQRLKGINMGGYHPAYPELNHPELTRFYHSLGVFLLLRRFGASLEEQLAGLIHDVSHTAFSHTYDYINEVLEAQEKQNFQDSIHEKFVKNSDIKKILSKYNFDLDKILDDTNWTLKENSVPDICADRIDYSIRQGYLVDKTLTKEQKDYILNSLVNYKGSFVFKDFDSAKFFAEFFWNYDKNELSGIKSAVMFGISGLLFRRAVEKKYIELEDFLNKTDKEIIAEIEIHKNEDQELKKYFDYLSIKADNFESNKNDYIRLCRCKVRKVDPYFIINNELKRVSDLDSVFKEKMTNRPKFNEYYLNKKR